MPIFRKINVKVNNKEYPKNHYNKVEITTKDIFLLFYGHSDDEESKKIFFKLGKTRINFNDKAYKLTFTHRVEWDKELKDGSIKRLEMTKRGSVTFEEIKDYDRFKKIVQNR